MLLHICHTALENALPFLECHMCQISHQDGDLFYVIGNGVYSAPCIIRISQREWVSCFGLCLYLDKTACSDCSTGDDVLIVPQPHAMIWWDIGISMSKSQSRKIGYEQCYRLPEVDSRDGCSLIFLTLHPFQLWKVLLHIRSSSASHINI